MNGLFIGVGGSGAKALESFVYLALTGLPGWVQKKGKDSAPLTYNLRVVDTDNSNANYKRLESLLEDYAGDYGLKQLFDTYNSKKKKSWNPTPIKYQVVDDGGVSNAFLSSVDLHRKSTLTELVEKDHRANGDERSRLLLDTLFTKPIDTDDAETNRELSDMMVPLEHGFFGKPRLGALLFATNLETDDGKEYWRRALRASFGGDDSDNRVMFTGSLFGGTGASGIPTISRAIYEDLGTESLRNKNGVSMGFLLRLPFYRFTDDKGVCPSDPNKWTLNSKVALRYYASSGFLNHFNGSADKPHKTTVYLVGAETNGDAQLADKKSVVPASGGKEQNNPAMPADLVTALSAVHFFGDEVRDKAVVWSEPSGDPSDGYFSYDCFPYKEAIKIALERLKMFCLTWTILVAKKPGQGVTNLKVYDYIREVFEDRGAAWNDHLGSVDAFAKKATNWLLELESNGVKLEFRNSFEQLEVDLNTSERPVESYRTVFPTAKKHSKRVSDVIFELANEVKKHPHRNLQESYHALFFGVLDLCSSTWKN